MLRIADTNPSVGGNSSDSPRGRAAEHSPSWSAGSGQRRPPSSSRSLPSTSQLADLYGVSNNTAYRALLILHDRELITRQQGRGTYVAERPGR
ncbi:GntR family transcriptional regulator [Micromonospora sp. NPDC005305]|uniref:GntR family transcriptional regulator n=1 Tax=Micromonospora sp. NPDC005305 TaxID=3156875 RepID=UPI0033ACE354